MNRNSPDVGVITNNQKIERFYVGADGWRVKVM